MYATAERRNNSHPAFLQRKCGCGVLYAYVTAYDRRGTLNATDLAAAVRREYRKSGDVCPLRG